MGDVSAMSTSVPAFGSTDASENEERDEELNDSSKNQFTDEQENTASSSKVVMGRTSRRWRAEKPQTLPLMSGRFARKQTTPASSERLSLVVLPRFHNGVPKRDLKFFDREANTTGHLLLPSLINGVWGFIAKNCARLKAPSPSLCRVKPQDRALIFAHWDKEGSYTYNSYN